MNFSLDLSIEALAHHCAAETERFFRKLAHDNRYCFELFRRAFVERNEGAWEKLYRQYTSLIVSWIREHPQAAAADEEVDYFVNGVLTSMWRSCTPDRFARFGDLPAVLAYLKSCVHTTIYNHLRKRRPAAAELSEELIGASATVAPASAVLDQIARTELWQLLDSLLQNEKERMVTDLYFIQGLKPRTIYDLHRDRFATVQEVYRVKQNLMERLSRNADLQQFYAELRENG